MHHEILKLLPAHVLAGLCWHVLAYLSRDGMHVLVLHDSTIDNQPAVPIPWPLSCLPCELLPNVSLQDWVGQLASA